MRSGLMVASIAMSAILMLGIGWGAVAFIKEKRKLQKLNKKQT